MDSLSTLQVKLHEAESILQYVRKELDGYSANSVSNENIDFSKLKLRGEQYGFYEHPIKGCHFQDEYMTLMLMVLLAGGAEEKGWNVLYQIAAGADYQNELPALVADAQTLKEERFVEILRMISSLNLARTFAIDSLLLCYHMGADEGQLNLLAGIYELLKLDKNFLQEAISFVQVLDSTLWEDYVERSREWKLLTAQDIATYLGGIAANSIEKAAGMSGRRIIVSDAYYNNTSMLQIEKWKTNGVLFMRCTFENIGGIYSHNKDIKFVDCVFKGNTPKYMMDYQWTDQDYSNNKYRAFYDLFDVSFVRCNLQDFEDAIPMMALDHGSMVSCHVSNCHQYNVSSNLINIRNSKISYSFFESCDNSIRSKYAVYKYGDSFVGCVLYSSNGLLFNITFKKCGSTVDNSSVDQYSHIIILDENSIMENCQFEDNYCSISSYDYHGKHKELLSIRNSREKDNKGIEKVLENARIPNTFLPKYRL